MLIHQVECLPDRRLRPLTILNARQDDLNLKDRIHGKNVSITKSNDLVLISNAHMDEHSFENKLN